jgi:geranylgeranyl pyrophosphate synthase
MRTAGGKSYRARLMLLLGDLLRAPREKIVRAAAAVEAVHLAALIHDDVLDGAGMRRGQAALYRSRGAAAALLLGDILLARGISAIHRLGSPKLTGQFLEAIAGTCAGEILEISRKGRPPWTEAIYYRITDLKTGALFRFCGEGAGILAGRGERTVAGLGRLGATIGRAYQIIDDCLDFAPRGSPLGKDRLADLKNAVPNLPLIHALHDPRTRSRVRAAIGAADRRRREAAGRAVRERGLVRRAAGRAERHLADARRALRTIGDGAVTGNPGPLLSYLATLEGIAAGIRRSRP